MTSPRLDGKVALVTGAGRGIGAGIAIELGNQGANIVVSWFSLFRKITKLTTSKQVNYSRSEAQAHQVVQSIQGAGGKAVAIKADISSPAEIRELFTAAKAAFGKLDI